MSGPVCPKCQAALASYQTHCPSCLAPVEGVYRNWQARRNRNTLTWLVLGGAVLGGTLLQLAGFWM